MDNVCNIAFKKVILIGFKSSGKTSVGKQLAEKIGFNFLDLDEVMEDKYQQSGFEHTDVRTIYKKFGEGDFRKLESKALTLVSKMTGTVLSFGGGTVLNPAFEKIDFLESVFVYLEVKPELLFERIKAKGFPPFFDKNDPEKSFEDLIKKRIPVYENIADITIDNGKQEVGDAVNEITKILEEVDGW